MIGHRLALTALLAVAATVALSGCGHVKPGSVSGCVIVDISGSSRPLINTAYLPGFVKFVQRIGKEGTGNVCFTYVGAGSTGGGAATAQFACTNRDDRVHCDSQIRELVKKAAGQLVYVGDQIANQAGPNPYRGASQILESIAAIAPATRPGDDILVLSDGIQNSNLTGNFDSSRETPLDDASIRHIIAKLRAARLLPNLAGRTIRIPYPLLSASHPISWSEERKQNLHRFYEAYGDATQARMRYDKPEDAK